MLSGEQAKFASAVCVKDLQSHQGSSVVIAGDHQPPAVHALAHAINQRSAMSVRLLSTPIRWTRIR